MQGTMMDALQIVGPETLRQVRVPMPVLVDGEILIKTAFVGICGTDVHLLQGKSFYYDHGFLKFPFIFGHEYTGYVVATRGVPNIKEGDRVVGHCMIECHACDNCLKGRRHLCRNLKEVGLRYVAGAAAEYVAVPSYAVSKVPVSLSLKAATLVEPAVTAYHALQRIGIRPDDTVGIIGSGALGLLSLLFAKLTAARVDVIGVEDDELKFAQALGADGVLHPSAVPDDRYSVVIECSGAAVAPALAVRSLDLGGRCALIGVCEQPARDLLPSLITLKDQAFHGILHGLDYYEQTVSLFASGRVDPTQLIAEVGKMEEATEIFDKLLSPKRTRPKYLIELAGEAA